MSKVVQASKFLSFVLRHQPEAIGLVLNADGAEDRRGSQAQGKPA